MCTEGFCGARKISAATAGDVAQHARPPVMSWARALAPKGVKPGGSIKVRTEGGHNKTRQGGFSYQISSAADYNSFSARLHKTGTPNHALLARIRRSCRDNTMTSLQRHVLTAARPSRDHHVLARTMRSCSDHTSLRTPAFLHRSSRSCLVVITPIPPTSVGGSFTSHLPLPT
jgi:hypothetical protein